MLGLFVCWGVGERVEKENAALQRVSVQRACPMQVYRRPHSSVKIISAVGVLLAQQLGNGCVLSVFCEALQSRGRLSYPSLPKSFLH